MPINLKEIFVSDTNQIKVDKINYNFDQIIGTGGQRGVQGPQGVQGNIGPVGPQGATGAQGAAGSTGAAGADGLDRWSSIPHAAVTGETSDYDTTILKPKIDPSTSGTQPTSIYLGDPNFSDLTSQDGDNVARSVLVVAKTDPFENNIRIIASTEAHDMVIRGDVDLTYGGAVFHIQKSDISDNLKIRGEISFNDISINATDSDTDKGIITLSSNKTEVISSEHGFNTAIGTKSYFNDRVHVVDADLLVQGTGFTRVSRGTTAERDNISGTDLLGGNIRYNSTTKHYEAYYENTVEGNKWLDLRKITDADGDTYISLPLSNDNDSITIHSAGQQFMRIGGTQLSLKAQSAANTTVPTIVTDKTVFARENVHFNVDNKGISFKEGPAASNTGEDVSTGGSAVNYDTPISNRTLSDFFYRSFGPFEIEDDTMVTPQDITSGDNFPGLTNVGDDCVLTNAFFRFNEEDLDDGSTDNPAGRLLTLINTGSSKLTYQKVGNMIHATVNLVWKPFWDNGEINGTNYPNGYPGTYFQETFGYPSYQTRYWSDTDIQSRVVRFVLPEMYARIPSKADVVSAFTHYRLSLADMTGGDETLMVQLKKGLGTYTVLSNNLNGFTEAMTVSDVKAGHIDNSFAGQGEWIYFNFSIAYPCEDKASWQANYSFNDEETGGTAPPVSDAGGTNDGRG
jgi:hypothetical protein